MSSIYVRASEAEVIAATSARDGAAVRPSLLHGSIPVSVRTILVRKLLAGWEGKVVTRIFASWNLICNWLTRLEGLGRAV
jgi:hypothetical protein